MGLGISCSSILIYIGNVQIQFELTCKTRNSPFTIQIRQCIMLHLGQSDCRGSTKAFQLVQIPTSISEKTVHTCPKLLKMESNVKSIAVPSVNSLV